MKSECENQNGGAVASKDGLVVRELWVGLHDHVRFHARNQGFPNPRIVSRHSEAVGFRGPLKIHLCGEWDELPEWRAIQDAFRAVEAMGDKVEWVKHY